MSLNLGDLKLNIILDIIKADENAKKFVGALKSVEVQSAKTETTTVSLKNKFQNLGLTVDGIRAAFSILKATLGDFVSSFQQQEIATAKLTNGLKNVGEGLSALNKLNEQASKLQSVTVYDDAEINNAQAMLTTFMKSSDEIEILTPRILDLAAAFDQSGEGGKSLQEVAVMIGKVNEETIGALRRVGVAFSKEQEEKLKSLRGTEQAIYLTEILDQNFKGLAETVGNTSAGRLKIFQNQIGELKEKFGELLVNALTPLLEPLKKFLDLIINSPERVQMAALAVSTLAVAFIALNGSIPGPLKYITLISAAVIGLPDHLRNLAVAIGIVTLAWKYQSTIVSGLDLLITRLGSSASAGFSALANAGSRASAILTLKLGAVATAIYAILELIDYINSNAEKMEKGLGKSDVLGGEDASLDNYEKSKLKGKNPNEFFTPEEQQKTREEITKTNKKIEETKGKLKGLGKTSANTSEDIAVVKDKLQLLQEEYDKLIEGFERPFKIVALEKAIELMKALGKPIKEILSLDKIKAAKVTEREFPRAVIEELPGGTKKDEFISRAEEYENKFTQSLSVATQISNVLGIGADTFAGKLLSGLQEGLSLANSIFQFIGLFANIGSGGILGLLGFAEGGKVPGSGTGDSIPAMLTPGEFVIRKSAVQRFGTGFMEWINGGGLLNSLTGKFATGGLVTGAGAGGVQVVVLDSRVSGNDIVLSQKRTEKIQNRRKL